MRLRRLEPVVRRALRGPCSIAPGGRLLVAVSGGADSVALLLGLRNVAREFGLSIHAAHLHHGLRGVEADEDLAFVRQLCARLGVALESARWDTRSRMRRLGLSGQAGLRALRRGFLLAAARRAKAAAIATAHTADDQLETVLMRLLRGAGIAGLAGMRPRRGVWLKPLLEATRADLETDLLAVGQAWRNDRSNADRHYLRSRLRHDAIPALLRASNPGAEPGPAARSALARRVGRAAAEAHEAAEMLERWSGRVLSRHCRIQAGEIALDSRGVASYPSAARRVLLRRAWAVAAPAAGGLTHRHLESLSRLVDGPRGGARVQLAGGWAAVRQRGWVRLVDPASGDPPGRPAAARPDRMRAPGPVWSGGASDRNARRGPRGAQ